MTTIGGKTVPPLFEPVTGGGLPPPFFIDPFQVSNIEISSHIDTLPNQRNARSIMSMGRDVGINGGSLQEQHALSNGDLTTLATINPGEYHTLEPDANGDSSNPDSGLIPYRVRVAAVLEDEITPHPNAGWVGVLVPANLNTTFTFDGTRTADANLTSQVGITISLTAALRYEIFRASDQLIMASWSCVYTLSTDPVVP